VCSDPISACRRKARRDACNVAKRGLQQQCVGFGRAIAVTTRDGVRKPHQLSPTAGTTLTPRTVAPIKRVGRKTSVVTTRTSGSAGSKLGDVDFGDLIELVRRVLGQHTTQTGCKRRTNDDGGVAFDRFGIKRQ
jgi:hypothetical protein